jgi:hypothetical protein
MSQGSNSAVMNDDQEHLRLLAIFHYVVAGFAGLFACLPMMHLALGIAIVCGALPEQPKQSELPPFVGWLIILMASLFILAGWTFTACIVAAGRSLARHKRYTFCLVVAAIECWFMPFGTVLGVFTIIILVRPSVKQLFEQQSSSLA